LIIWTATSCSKDGDTIYMPDPNDAKPDFSPLITVIYDPVGVGDLSYNDMIYKSVESTALKLGARTLQLQPYFAAEGELMLDNTLAQLCEATDTVKRLLIVTGEVYDEYIRKNNHRLEKNPNSDLLYIETNIPLEGKGSTFFIDY